MGFARTLLFSSSAVAFATLLGCSNSGDDKGCTLLDCSSSMTFLGYATLPHDEMQKATIVACLKGSCSQGKPASLPGTSNDKIQVALSGGVSAQAYIYSPDSKGYKVEVVYSISDQSPKNGDPYELKILAGDGSTHDDYQATATYQEVTPNGKDCPPVCKISTIDKTM